MYRSILLTLLLLTPAFALSSEISVSVSQTGCLPMEPDAPDEILVSVDACALRIRHRNVVTNCCLEYQVKATVEGRSIELQEIDVGPPCDCLCPFDLEVILPGLESGVYRLAIDAFLRGEPVIQEITIPDHCEVTWIFAPMVWTHPAIEGLTVPVYATHEQALEAFSFGTTFPLEHARMAEVHLRGTDAELAGAAFVSVEIDNGAGESEAETGWATCSVILNSDLTANGGGIPPGAGRHLANLVYDILPPTASVPRSISIPFPERVGDPRVPRSFTLDSVDIQPAAEAGIIQIVLPLPEFLRGDANDDRIVDISDAHRTLDFLSLDAASCHALTQPMRTMTGA